MDELHKTGQVSAFINNIIDSNHCKMNTSEDRLLSADRCSLVKLEVMNIAEGEVEITAQAMKHIC
jgi:hypothetical protein